MATQRFEIVHNLESVEVWLDRRLPFEPRGEMLEARNELRKAIGLLKCSLNRILKATYTSLDDSFCDVENVLFYNVGTLAFLHASSCGLLFERIRAAPKQAPSGRSFSHHYSYSFVQAAALPIGRRVCEFQFPFHAISSSTKPHLVWWAASRTVTSSHMLMSSPFELHIILNTPTPISNLAPVIKPLLDGIICAMHSEVGVDAEAVRRLSSATGWTSSEISARLRSPSNPVLGARHLLRSYRDFVKWDPADELCERCTLLVSPATSLSCSVSMFTYTSVAEIETKASAL